MIVACRLGFLVGPPVGAHDECNDRGGPDQDESGAESLDQIRGNGRPPASLDGTFTQASPSRTTSPATEHVQASRARNFSGINSETRTRTSTVSPIFTGARKFNVCEI